MFMQGRTREPSHFVTGGSLITGEPFITRPAPGLGSNIGGGIEIITNSNSVKIDFFHMPG